MNRMESVDTAASAAGVKAIATAAPSITGLAMWLSNKDINFWVGVVSIGFILLQSAYLVWKWRRDARVGLRAGLSD